MPGTAFEYLLQRRQYSKRFNEKTFGDHLFIEAAFTPNAILSNGKSQFSGTANVAIGDWLTPEHGWRGSIGAGFYKTGGIMTKTLQISGDYLMNLTAIGQAEYDTPKPLELLGVAGIDGMLSRKAGKSHFGLGAHIGLRGQAALGRAGYIFLEPRLTVMSDDAIAMPSSFGLREATSVSFGLGLHNTAFPKLDLSKMPPWWKFIANIKWPKGEPYITSNHFLDDTFISFGLGGGTLLTSTPSQWRHYTGPTASMSIGKWFSPTQAIRLTGKVEAYKQREEGRSKAIGARADYMFNIYNALAGYHRNAPFTLSLIGGVSYNISESSDKGRKGSLGLGLGMQTAFRMAKGVELFVEPRVDAYDKNYAINASTTNGFDVAGSIQMGLNFRQGLDTRQQRARNGNFVHKSAYDHFFLEGAIGTTMPFTSSTIRNPKEAMRPKAYAAVGKWHSPTGGLRIWAEAEQLRFKSAENSKESIAFGADYLWNATNTFHGYRPNRPLELITGLGLNFATRSGSKRLYPGLGGTVKVLWNVTPMVGIYLQPMARAYNNDFLKGVSNFTKLDYTTSVLAGLQLRLSGYQPAMAREDYEENGAEGSFSIAGGLAAQGSAIIHPNLWGEIGRLSYTRSSSPLTAWRFSISGYHTRLRKRQYAKAAIEGDYLVDLTTLGLGYDPERTVHLSAFAGIGIGADHNRGKTKFAPSVHSGAKLAVRLAPKVSAFVEPRVGYEFSSRYKGSRLPHIQSSAQLGLDFHFKARPLGKKAEEAPERPSFVSMAFGTGAYTGSIMTMPSLRRKFTFIGDITAGHWQNAQSGYAFGVSTTGVQRNGNGNQWLTSIHADYLFNLRTMFTDSEDNGNPLRLTGAVGANVTFSTKKSYNKTYVAPGLQASLEAGWRFTTGMELFLRPQATLYTQGITGKKGHPAEGEVRLLLGTKMWF